MGFFNKLEDETKRILSQTDDFVNEEIPGGWYTVAALASGGAGYGMNGGFGAGTSGAGGAGGFSFLPSGEMTVFSPETLGATGGTGGGTNFLSNLFTGSSELAPMGNDYSRMVEMYPTSSGNIFEPAGMSPSQISSIQQMGDQALLRDQLASRQRMPDFGQQTQQQAAQQLAQLNQDNQSGGMRKGQAIPQAILSSLLDPANALKVYRPTLI